MTLTWPANPEPDVAGYRVYYGAASGAYTNTIAAGNVTTNTVPGLLEGVTYYFLVTAYNTSGLESLPSGELIFTVPLTVPSARPPIAGTMLATVGSRSAVLHGAVNPNGAATLAWFEYGLDSDYGFSTAPTTLSNATSTLWVSSPIFSLLPGQTYHYRVVASNSAGLTNGTDVAFTLPAAPPVVATQPATDIRSGMATLNGVISPNGADTFAWFEYGADSAYGLSTTPLDLGAGNSTLALNVLIDGLLPGVTYHFRTVANNSAGLRTGPDLAFTIPASAPVLAAQPASAVTPSTATLNALVNPDGAPTTAWFEYGLNTNYGLVTGPANLAPGNDALVVSSALSGLLPDKIYHQHLVASNSAGLVLGPDMTFRTLRVPTGASVTLAWPANTEPDMAGYIIYYGPATGAYTNALNVGNLTNYTVSGLVDEATYYFSVSAYNAAGLESVASQEISVTVPTGFF